MQLLGIFNVNMHAAIAALSLCIISVCVSWAEDTNRSGKYPDIYPFKDESAALDQSAFFETLNDALKNNTVGYGILATRDTQTIYSETGGFRIAVVDDQSNSGVPFDLSTRMHVASITKTITGVALIKALSDRGLSLEVPFADYLPSFWKIHPSFQEMPIKYLLNMQSGITATNDAFTSSYESLREIIEMGVNAEHVGKSVYANANYGLLRIVIAYLSGYEEVSYIEGYDRNEPRINNAYMNYINEYLFRPAGFYDVRCYSSESKPTLMYPFPHADELGLLTSKGESSENGDNMTNYVGGLGLHLSITDVSRFINTLFFSDDILSANDLITFTDQPFPFIRIDKPLFESGYAMGLWIESVEDSGYLAGANTISFVFPDRVAVTIFVNSWNRDAPLLDDIVASAYEDAL